LQSQGYLTGLKVQALPALEDSDDTEVE
jgi:hypothetical protein